MGAAATPASSKTAREEDQSVIVGSQPTVLADDFSRKFLLEEYSALWTYYLRTIDERHKVIEYFFRAVTLPASFLILGSILANAAGVSPVASSDQVSGLLCFTFIVLSLSGISCFLYYVMETSNSYAYGSALADIRDYVVKRDPDLYEAITLKSRQSYMQTRFVEMTFYRAGPLVLINSALPTAAVAAIFGLEYWLLVLAFASMLTFHLVIWFFRKRKGALPISSPVERTTQ